MVDLVFDIIPQIANESGIYAISNNVDERLYIGRTNNFMRRFFEHARKFKGKKRNKKKPKRRIGESTMSIKEFVQYLAKRHRR